MKRNERIRLLLIYAIVFASGLMSGQFSVFLKTGTLWYLIVSCIPFALSVAWLIAKWIAEFIGGF